MALAPEVVQCMPLQPGPDHHFAPSFQDAGRRAETQCVKLRVAHTTPIAKDVHRALGRLVGGMDMGAECVNDGAQFSVIQFGTTRRGPSFGLWADGTEDRLSGSVQGFFSVVPIQDRNGLGKQLRSGVPNK